MRGPCARKWESGPSLTCWDHSRTLLAQRARFLEFFHRSSLSRLPVFLKTWQQACHYRSRPRWNGRDYHHHDNACQRIAKRQSNHLRTRSTAVRDECADLKDLAGGDPAMNAAITRAILAETRARAATLPALTPPARWLRADLPRPQARMKLAADSIDSGRARNILMRSWPKRTRSSLTMDFLEQIMAQRWKAAERTERRGTEAVLKAQAAVRTHHSLKARLADQSKTRIIAEVKKASPSAGIIVPRYAPAGSRRNTHLPGNRHLGPHRAKAFQGLRNALESGSLRGRLTRIAKGFHLPSFPVLEAAAWHADVILLIARA